MATRQGMSFQPRIFEVIQTMGSFIRNVGVAILSLLLVPATGLAVKFRRTQYPHHKNQHIPEKSGITSPMQSIHPNVNSISDLATGNGNDATPFSQQSVMLTKQTYIELTWKANYWQQQHAQSREREAALTA